MAVYLILILSFFVNYIQFHLYKMSDFKPFKHILSFFTEKHLNYIL